MSNYSEQHDKIAIHLQELYQKHRKLDEEITLLYNNFESEQILNRMKTQKLWLKDEMHRLETELKQLG
jgi:hypothetical protein|tara:strand:- start:371 stop:574 length:204 start_codon:yes stop_codon:yes gene_type:complete